MVRVFKKLLMLGGIAAIAGLPQVDAIEFGNVVRSESLVGIDQRRKVEIQGAYKLSAGERLDFVQFVYNSGEARGTSTSIPTTWRGGVIDASIKTYRVDFHITQAGRKRIYSTPVYTYGVR